MRRLNFKIMNTQKNKHVSKLFGFLLLLTIAAIQGKAQSLISIPGQDTVIVSAILADSITIEEKLVKLALNGPVYKTSFSQNKINEYRLRAEKNTWINLFTINTIYNNQTINQNNNGSFLFPGASFGLSIPLGTILSSKSRVNSARQQVAISAYTQEQLARDIKANILGKYKQYLNLSQLISIQTQTVDDEETAYLQAKEQFRNGLIKIDEYSTAQKLYNIELSKKLNFQLEQELLKLEIERTIGTTIESVINSSNTVVKQ
jgi:archaellum component FlaF (FlaF/FlaG flagellin family)